MQGLASELKAEVRELLATHGITSFVVKPVKRSYAFENRAIPHGQHWVLKVRYPGSLPTLPLGTTGASSIYAQHCHAWQKAPGVAEMSLAWRSVKQQLPTAHWVTWILLLLLQDDPVPAST